MMLLLFSSSKAPGITDEFRNEFNVRLWNYYLDLKYEAEFTRFVNHLGYKESRNDWTIVNTIGCLGEWQFSGNTLKYLGYGHINIKTFKADPSIFPRELQLKVLRELIAVNSIELKEYECFIGTAINGVIITRAGLLAGSHLGGVGSVSLYLNSIGKIDRNDIYGTRVSDYIREFGLYNL